MAISGLGVLQRVSDQIVSQGNRTAGLEGLFNSSRASTPWLYLEIDRTKCMALGLLVSDVFNTLQAAVSLTSHLPASESEERVAQAGWYFQRLLPVGGESP